MREATDMTMMNPLPAWDPWVYPEAMGWQPTDSGEHGLAGYHVEATDGSIGKIDEVGDGFLVVDTGPWIFGTKVMLPNGVVDNIDTAERKVYVDRTKEEIRSAPEYAPELRDSVDYRESLGKHYAR
jgi:hypothetical protein